MITMIGPFLILPIFIICTDLSAAGVARYLPTKYPTDFRVTSTTINTFPMSNTQEISVRIYVRDSDELPLAEADVSIIQGRDSVKARYSADLGAFTATCFPSAELTVRVRCAGYLEQSRAVSAWQDLQLLVMLARPDQPYYYDLRPRPYTPHRDVICVLHYAGQDEGFQKLIRKLDLVEIKDYVTKSLTWENMFMLERRRLIFADNGVHFYRKADSSQIVGTVSDELDALRTSGMVDFAGCVVSADKFNFSAFDNTFRFIPKINADTSVIMNILGRHDVEDKDVLTAYDGTGWWRVTAPPILAEGVLDIMNELWASGQIESMVNNFRQVVSTRR